MDKSAAIDHAADMRTLAKRKRAIAQELRIEARAVWRTIEAETTRHNAIFARIRSIEQEIADCASTAREIGRP